MSSEAASSTNKHGHELRTLLQVLRFYVQVYLHWEERFVRSGVPVVNNKSQSHYTADITHTMSVNCTCKLEFIHTYALLV